MDRYEKALELARSYYDKDANTFLDTIFPELKESRNEQIRKAIIKSLDMPFPEDNLPGTDVTYAEAVAWLKSLHPSWKPDGQQLDCLRHMINVSTVDKIDKQFVQDLYEQLKKLM